MLTVPCSGSPVKGDVRPPAGSAPQGGYQSDTPPVRPYRPYGTTHQHGNGGGTGGGAYPAAAGGGGRRRAAADTGDSRRRYAYEAIRHAKRCLQEEQADALPTLSVLQLIWRRDGGCHPVRLPELDLVPWKCRVARDMAGWLAHCFNWDTGERTHQAVRGTDEEWGRLLGCSTDSVARARRELLFFLGVVAYRGLCPPGSRLGTHRMRPGTALEAAVLAYAERRASRAESNPTPIAATARKGGSCTPANESDVGGDPAFGGGGRQSPSSSCDPGREKCGRALAPSRLDWLEAYPQWSGAQVERAGRLWSAGGLSLEQIVALVESRPLGMRRRHWENAGAAIDAAFGAAA